MANVKAKVIAAKFTHKGKTYLQGEEVSLSPAAAKVYANIDVIQLTKEVEKKVEEKTAPAKK